MNETRDRIEYHETATTFVGPTAVDVFRAATLASSLRLYGEHGLKTHRGFKLGYLLTMATGYTGKTYPKSRRGALLAAIDVNEVVALRKVAFARFRPDVFDRINLLDPKRGA